jgi:hypothetical protein
MQTMPRRRKARPRPKRARRAAISMKGDHSAGPTPSSRKAGCSPFMRPGWKRDTPDEEPPNREPYAGKPLAVRRAGRQTTFLTPIEQEYYADGVVEDIATAPSRVPRRPRRPSDNRGASEPCGERILIGTSLRYAQVPPRLGHGRCRGELRYIRRASPLGN